MTIDELTDSARDMLGRPGLIIVTGDPAPTATGLVAPFATDGDEEKRQLSRWLAARRDEIRATGRSLVVIAPRADIVALFADVLIDIEDGVATFTKVKADVVIPSPVAILS